MKRAGLAFSTALILSAIAIGGARAAPQQFGRMFRGGQMGAMSSAQLTYGRGSGVASSYGSTQTGTQQGSCQAANQGGGQLLQGQSTGSMSSQMGGGLRPSSSGGTTQVTVAPVRSSTELTQLLKVVQAATSGSSFQVKPNGDGQSATVSIQSEAGTSSTTLAQTLQSSGFQILEVSVQGSGRSQGTGSQQQGRSGSYSAMTSSRAQYGQAARVAAQNSAALQARSIQQYRAAVQGRYR